MSTKKNKGQEKRKYQEIKARVGKYSRSYTLIVCDKKFKIMYIIVNFVQITCIKIHCNINLIKKKKQSADFGKVAFGI